MLSSCNTTPMQPCTQDRLHETFYANYPSKKLRLSEKFEKILCYLKSESIESRQLGIELSKSQLGLDPFDIVHRIKKLCLYHKDFNIDGFVSSLNTLEKLSKGWRVSSILNTHPDSEHIHNSTRLYAYVGECEDSSLQEELFHEQQQTIANVIRNNNGDFYETFLLHFHYKTY
jgi:hypothetical protein